MPALRRLDRPTPNERCHRQPIIQTRQEARPMSDAADDFRAIKEWKRAHQIDCPRCRHLLPKASPKKLLPGQRCRRDGYIDPRKA